jgi:hypothetical protein
MSCTGTLRLPVRVKNNVNKHSKKISLQIHNLSIRSARGMQLVSLQVHLQDMKRLSCFIQYMKLGTIACVCLDNATLDVGKGV